MNLTDLPNIGTSSLMVLYERLAATAQPDWVARLRKQAMAAFLETGFPTKRHEEWKYTSLATLAERAYRLAQAPKAEELAQVRENLPAPLGAFRAVLLDGFFLPELSSLPKPSDGVVMKSLRRALHEDADILHDYLGRLEIFADKPMSALNTALWQDGLFLYVHRDAVASEPVEILHLDRAARGDEWNVVSPRVLLMTDEHTRAVVLERFLGLEDGESLVNSVTEIRVAPSARLDHIVWQTKPDDRRRIHSLRGRVLDDAVFHAHVFSLGAAPFRADVEAVLRGEGAQAEFYGLHVTDEARHVDLHTLLDHAAAHTTSRETVKGVLDGRSVSVFNGKVIVRQQAQKTDSEQRNHNLLLSDKATANAKPQLEIFADDVRCGHGATIGGLDESARFYLRSRGLPEAEADGLLLRAFASEILNKLPHALLREEAFRTFDEALSSRESGKENSHDR